MHRYNNQDHSMLAANSAVSSIVNGGSNKLELWQTNAEGEYHEEITELGDSGNAAKFAS
jgi:hypothetical protein